MTRAEASAPRPAPFELQRLSDRVQVAVEPGRDSNAEIILGEKGPIVIDSLLSPNAGEALLTNY